MTLRSIVRSDVDHNAAQHPIMTCIRHPTTEVSAMITQTVHFTAELAPCGKMHDGTRHEENDDEGLLRDDQKFSCGCRTIRHVYHDGTVRIRSIRHDGKVLRNEHSGDHEG